MLKGLTKEEEKTIIPENTFLLGYVGSHSHGTFVPKNDPDSIDDIDIMGVAFAPVNVYLGLQGFEQKDIQYKEWDSVVYEVKKFFKLLLRQNPNVLGLLYLREQDYIHISEAGKELLNNRNLFVSSKAYNSFIGYAKDQFHKMTHFQAYQGYMGAKRKVLVDKFGYDCKNAGHLIRLLRMGIEYLNEGELHVFRERDAEELIAIKNGKFPLEHIVEEAKKLFKLAEEAYENSELPEQPNYIEAEKLLMKLMNNYLKHN